jgi:serpin B
MPINFENMKAIYYLTALLMPLLGISQNPAQSAQAHLISALNQHSLELTQQLYKPGANLFCSPYSLSAALAMTYAGASGLTAEEMEKVMHYPQTLTHEGFLMMTKRMAEINAKEKVKLAVANALWNRLKLHPDYLAITKKYYNAEVYPLTSETPINDWASKNTNGKIPKVLEPGDITPLVKLVLTNAIYFKGDWVKTFDKENTQEAQFYQSDKSISSCSLMYAKDDFKYGQFDGFQAIELPYSGDDLSMVVLLPQRESSLKQMLLTLNMKELDTQLRALKNQKVELWLPKFKLETSYELKDVLMQMGMNVPFKNADFSKMTIDKTPLEISRIIQKAFVEVNEKGTEAAAVTVVMMATESSINRNENLIPQFRADRPFLFLIRDKQTGAILFTGGLEKP